MCVCVCVCVCVWVRMSVCVIYLEALGLVLLHGGDALVARGDVLRDAVLQHRVLPRQRLELSPPSPSARPAPAPNVAATQNQRSYQIEQRAAFATQR